jgi:hypothetical protein
MQGLDDFSFLAMRYKAQGFPKGGALYLIAEKKREDFHAKSSGSFPQSSEGKPYAVPLP